MRGLIGGLALALVVFVPSCRREAGHDQEGGPIAKTPGGVAPLAIVGGEAITVKEFEAEMVRRARAPGVQFATVEQRSALLEEMIEFEVLLQRARAAGYDRDPELRARLNRLVVDKFTEDQLTAGAGDGEGVSEEEAREFYRRHQEEFSRSESVRVAIVHLKASPKATVAKRAEVKAKAEAVLGAAREVDAAGFRDLARRYSEDQATRYDGGDLGCRTREETRREMGAAFEQAAFALRAPGEFAPVVETSRGFYILRLIERRPAGVRAYEDVREVVKYRAARQRRQQRQTDFLDRMRRGLEITSNPSLLAKIAGPERPEEDTPPRLPGTEVVAGEDNGPTAQGTATGGQPFRPASHGTY